MPVPVAPPSSAELAGNGSAAEAKNPLILDRTGEGLANAIEAALREAGVTPNDVDHVQAHGVSLDMYDHCETNAYKRVFGKHAYRVAISGVKSMVGQSYSAGGLLGVGAALLALNDGTVAPTINLDDPDPICDSHFVPRRARLNHVATAVVCSISFGGTHSAAVLRRLN